MSRGRGSAPQGAYLPDGSVLDRRFDRFPGWELVRQGLHDVAIGRRSVEAALVRSASQRLAALGIEVSAGAQVADEHLYSLVQDQVGERRAHSRYNALRRRLVSFLRAAAGATAG